MSRHMLCTMLLGMLVLLHSGPSRASGQMTDDAAQLKRQLEDNRRRIASGRLEITVYKHGTVSEGRIYCHDQVSFQGSSIRRIRTWPGKGDSESNGQRNVEILTDEFYARRDFTGDWEPITSPSVFYVGSSPVHSMYDPRTFGWNTYFSGLQYASFEEGIVFSGRTGGRVEAGELDGRPIRKLVLLRPDYDGAEGRIEYWLDPKRGSELVRVLGVGYPDPKMIKDFDSGFELTDDLRIELSEFDGVWFAKQSTFQRAANGVVADSEHVVLDKAEFNIELSDDEFDLSQLRLNFGDIFHEYPQPHPVLSRRWDGTKPTLFTKDTVEPRNLPQAANPEPTRRLWVIILASVATCGFALLYFLNGRRG
jgi:hypothetical protein